MMSAAPAEMVLATYYGAGSSSGPEQPPQPYGMRILVGVDAQLLPGYTEDPDPMVFTTRVFEDNTNYIARPWNTSGLGVMLDRLTDGENTTMLVSTHSLQGGGGSVSGPESGVLEYDAALPRVGPDLQGYTVTGVQVELDLEVTFNAGRWTQAYECTISILGY